MTEPDFNADTAAPAAAADQHPAESAAAPTLRERIEVASERSAAAAADSARKARDFVEEHPVAVVAGGLVLGALLAGAVARSRRKRPTAADAVAEGASSMGKLAALGAELAMAYAARAAHAGKEGLGALEDIGSTVGETLGETGSEARRRASDFAEIALAGVRGAGEAALRHAADLRHKLGK